MNCNPETGTCELPAGIIAAAAPRPGQARATLHYFGDPMCSWCWGLSEELKQIAQQCERLGVGLQLTMGGLRAGGGDPWVPAFKEFLRREWTHIASTTGQPFGFTLLDAPQFEYDTEPACRAVVVAEQQQRQRGEPVSSTLRFFSAVQRKFYVEGADPKQVEFYASVCAETGLDFALFRAAFAAPAARQAVEAHFARCRSSGVRGFPSLSLESGGQLLSLASGYVKAAVIVQGINQTLAAQASGHA